MVKGELQRAEEEGTGLPLMQPEGRCSLVGSVGARGPGGGRLRDVRLRDAEGIKRAAFLLEDPLHRVPQVRDRPPEPGCTLPRHPILAAGACGNRGCEEKSNEQGHREGSAMQASGKHAGPFRADCYGCRYGTRENAALSIQGAAEDGQTVRERVQAAQRLVKCASIPCSRLVRVVILHLSTCRENFVLRNMLREAMNMRDAHLSVEEFRLLLEDNEEIRNRLLLHHLAICPACYAVAGYILDLYLAGEVGIDLCTVDIDLAQSRREAPALVEELAPYPFEAQQALVRDDARFWSWGLAELLCALSEKEAPGNPGRARELAALAVAVSSSFEEWEQVEGHWLDEMRGYALAHLGNALRVLGDLRGARDAFAAADLVWEPAAADLGNVLGYEARYLALQASFRRAERRLPEALRLLEQALAAEPEPSLKARILINKAKTLEELGRMDEAINLLSEVQSEAGADLDARLRLCLVQNHLDYLSKAGRFVEAEILTADVEPLVTELGSAIDRLRFLWTKARISKSLGRSDEALRAFEAVRTGFVQLDMAYDVVLVSLEHALALATLGQNEEVVRIVEETLLILRNLSVEREGLMAVRLLAEAVAGRSLTAELIQNVLDYLRRAMEAHAASEMVP
jgi:tetratricopeptide (TPR) repeat protein